MPSISTVWPGLSEIEDTSLPPFCSVIEWMSPVMQTIIEPSTLPFEPVMVAVPVSMPAVKVWPLTVPLSLDTV